MVVLAYNGLLVLTLVDIISIALSIVGIVIGLIIAYHQHGQGVQIHDQGRRTGDVVIKVDEQSKDIGETLSQVNTQTEQLEALLKDVSAVNKQVEVIISEAKTREDKRKYHHLTIIKRSVINFRKVAIETVQDIEGKYIRNSSPPTQEEHDHTRDYIETHTIEHLKDRLNFINGHFNKVDHLLNSPDLASRVLVDHLWSTIFMLTNALRHTGVIYDRVLLLQSLNDLKNQRIKGLDYVLQEIEREIPEVYGPPPSERNDDVPSTNPTA